MQIARAREPPGEHRREPRVQVGLACERGIQRFQLLGRLHQQCRGVAAAARRERDPPAQQGGARLVEFIQRSCHRHGEQLGPRIQGAGLQARLRGREGALGPQGGFAGELGRALQERRRRGHAAAGLGPARRPLQLRGHLFIGSCRRRRQVPCSPIRVIVAIGHLGQRPVRRPPLRRRRRRVHRRAHQRMPEPHPRTDLQQPLGLGSPPAARTRPPARRAAAPAGPPAGPAASRTADASWRTPAPSPTPPPPPGPAAYPPPPRSRTPAAPTCPPPPRPAPPAPVRVPIADLRAAHRARRALAGGPAAPVSAHVAYSCSIPPQVRASPGQQTNRSQPVDLDRPGPVAAAAAS